jgi:hypothetical protein
MSKRIISTHMRTMYECDPEKAKATCKRTHCKAMGYSGFGECYTTSHPEYAAINASGKPKIVFMEPYGLRLVKA